MNHIEMYSSSKDLRDGLHRVLATTDALCTLAEPDQPKPDVSPAATGRLAGGSAGWPPADLHFIGPWIQNTLTKVPGSLFTVFCLPLSPGRRPQAKDSIA